MLLSTQTYRLSRFKKKSAAHTAPSFTQIRHIMVAQDVCNEPTEAVLNVKSPEVCDIKKMKRWILILILEQETKERHN